MSWCSGVQRSRNQPFLPKNKFESLAEFSYLWSEIGVLNIYNLVGRVGDGWVVVNVWVHVPSVASCWVHCISCSFNFCLLLFLNWGVLSCGMPGSCWDSRRHFPGFGQGFLPGFLLSFFSFYPSFQPLSFSFVYAGIPLVRLPTICRVPLDLYRAYNSVQQLGGFVNVSWASVSEQPVLTSCTLCYMSQKVGIN